MKIFHDYQTRIIGEILQETCVNLLQFKPTAEMGISNSVHARWQVQTGETHEENFLRTECLSGLPTDELPLLVEVNN